MTELNDGGLKGLHTTAVRIDPDVNTPFKRTLHGWLRPTFSFFCPRMSQRPRNLVVQLSGKQNSPRDGRIFSIQISALYISVSVFYISFSLPYFVLHPNLSLLYSYQTFKQNWQLTVAFFAIPNFDLLLWYFCPHEFLTSNVHSTPDSLYGLERRAATMGCRNRSGDRLATNACHPKVDGARP